MPILYLTLVYIYIAISIIATIERSDIEEYIDIYEISSFSIIFIPNYIINSIGRIYFPKSSIRIWSKIFLR